MAVAGVAYDRLGRHRYLFTAAAISLSQTFARL